MLGRLRMTVDECIAAYTSLSGAWPELWESFQAFDRGRGTAMANRRRSHHMALALAGSFFELLS
ncbi:hypothetical protein BGZ61DRAFT_447233 [Ilyonectria robusta]|uniref:uncharacterized protein n=1 Tax=Ilyonectria robusta TaxID=1079257 RepID=UPI001E8DEFE1|nr:uncharacterized protein BGZ61DRAFT_447233 [Ilyonectria robusta]KAH8729988.1 hypothetical protein BGZ61DRAFT_447233 [Ilyonectria robusta]